MTDSELHAYVLKRATDIQAAVGWDRDRCEDIAFLCVCSELGLGCEATGEKVGWMKIVEPNKGGRDGDEVVP